MKKVLLTLLTILIIFSCTSEQKNLPSERSEEIIAKFTAIVLLNRLKADSISNVHNIHYKYIVPIKTSNGNGLYYGLCDEDTTDGFIFSLHYPDKIIDLSIYPVGNEYYGIGDNYQYKILF